MTLLTPFFLTQTGAKATAKVYYSVATYIRALVSLKLEIGAGVTGSVKNGEATQSGELAPEKDLFMKEFTVLLIFDFKAGVVGGLNYELTVNVGASGILKTGYDISYGVLAGFNVDSK
jgi:hypothetical protein